MKHRMFVVTCLAAMASCAAAGQSAQNASSTASWTGVWQGSLDGVPSVTLTLANDTGELGGTIVLNMIERGTIQPRILASNAHILLHPHLDGNMLSFGVKRRNESADLLNFNVELTPAGKIALHCSNCGADAPEAELVKAQ